MLKELLEQDGFLVMLRSGGVPHMGPAAPYEVLVPDAEIREAHEALAQLLVQIPSRRPDPGRAPGGEPGHGHHRDHPEEAGP